MGAHGATKNTLSFKQFLSPSDFRLGACPFPQAAQLLQIGIVFLVLALSPLGFLGLKHVKLPLLERTSCCKEILCENSNFSAAFCSRKILIMLLYILYICANKPLHRMSAHALIRQKLPQRTVRNKKGAPDHPCMAWAEI